ncbi:MAG TPA: NAD(P)-dependent oxidoreductase [Acidimicrobiales bacterium]
MKILVAGASGALGRQLVPRLVAAGHEVTGTTRRDSRAGAIRELGATPAVLDALDASQVERVVAEAEPEVIVHELTSLSGPFQTRHIDRFFATTNRLRTEATEHLLAAGRAVGTRRFVAQSWAGWSPVRAGSRVKTEEDLFDPSPPAAVRPIFDSLRRLERTLADADWVEHVVLRYGALYGPDTSLGPDGEETEIVRARRFPVVGDGSGVWSFLHVGDAADATVLAVDKGHGVYNIVDDEPAPVAQWLPALAAAIGAKPPWRVPRWVGRLMAGEAAVIMMTESAGASNEKAKRELGWSPAHPSWRQGFAEVLRPRPGGMA